MDSVRSQLRSTLQKLRKIFSCWYQRIFDGGFVQLKGCKRWSSDKRRCRQYGWTEKAGKHYYEIILSGNGHIWAERNKRAAVRLQKAEMESFNEVKGQLTKRACGQMWPELCVWFTQSELHVTQRQKQPTGGFSAHWCPIKILDMKEPQELIHA